MVKTGSRLAVLVVCLALGATALAGGVAAADEPQPRIVGGERVDIGEYPFVVYLANPDGFQFCGGTLVSPVKVLTAAHCAGGRPQEMRVVAGRADKKSTRGTVVPVRDIWVHPRYQGALSGADVAVLTLARPLAYRQAPYARAADVALYRPGVRTTILGWGRTSEGGQASRYLLRASVPVVDDADCARSLPRFDERSMVCAGLPEGGVDGCQGDSGGPILAGGKLIGISSWGEGCGSPGKPGVYARLAAYAEDIDRQLVPSQTAPALGHQRR